MQQVEAHLAGQEVQLGDSGYVSMQAGELHTRSTIAEGSRSRVVTSSTEETGQAPASSS